MLSAGLLLLEIGFGTCDSSEEIKAKALCTEEDHVVRAYELLVLLLGVRDIWHVLTAPAGAGDGQKVIGNVRITQQVSAPGRVASSSQRRWCLAAGAGGARRRRRGDAGFEGGASAPEVAQEGASRALLPTDPPVLGVGVGYGPGASVQRADVGTPFMHDHQIMRATLLRGTHVIYGSDVCGSISHRTTAKEGQKRLRTSLKVAHWE